MGLSQHLPLDPKNKNRHQKILYWSIILWWCFLSICCTCGYSLLVSYEIDKAILYHPFLAQKENCHHILWGFYQFGEYLWYTSSLELVFSVWIQNLVISDKTASYGQFSHYKVVLGLCNYLNLHYFRALFCWNVSFPFKFFKFQVYFISL